MTTLVIYIHNETKKAKQLTTNYGGVRHKMLLIGSVVLQFNSWIQTKKDKHLSKESINKKSDGHDEEIDETQTIHWKTD